MSITLDLNGTIAMTDLVVVSIKLSKKCRLP